MRQVLTVLSMVLWLISCQTKQSSSANDFQTYVPDTTTTGKPGREYERLRKWSKQIKLPSIDTWVTGFELRLWTSGMVKPGYLIVLRKSGTSISAQEYKYYTVPDSINHYELPETRRNGSVIRLIDSLQRIDFTKMISQDEIAGLHDNIADGITYHIEVAAPGYYRLLSYHCPESFAETNHKRFVDLLLAVDRQFHFYNPYYCIPQP